MSNVLTDVLTGRFLSGDNDDKAKKYLEDATGAFDGINAPQLNPVDLKDYSWLGDLTPELIGAGGDVQFHGTNAHLADAATAGPSAMEGVSTDPRLKDQQMASLSALQDLASRGGMNDADTANLTRVQNQTAQADRGRREAILQNMAARGMGGSGNELLAQLQSNQAATDRQAQQGLDLAGMAQQRALDAMMKGGQLAGDVRGQDFGEAAQRAAAMDAIAKFNAQQQTGANQFNASQAASNDQFNAGHQVSTDLANRDTNLGVAKFNAGQTQDATKYNVGGRQNTANANVDTTNKETTINAGLPQQGFDNQVKLAGGKAGAAQAGVNYYQGESAADRDAYGNLIAGGAQMGAAGITKSDERAKKDIKTISPEEIDAFLASLQPKKFKYKSKKDGDGERSGVMAQDLLKSHLGSDAVVQMDDGDLGIDKDKMMGLQLAALKHLADKIDKKG